MVASDLGQGQDPPVRAKCGYFEIGKDGKPKDCVEGGDLGWILGRG